jgi:hypothetical protein
MNNLFKFFIILCCLLPGMNFAGVQLTYKRSGGKQMIVSVEGDKVSVSKNSGGNSTQVDFLFFGNIQKVYALNNQDKTYMEMDKDKLTSMKETLSGIQQQMKKAMESLPENMRGAIAQKMKKMNLSNTSDKLRLEKKKSEVVVNSWKTEHFQILNKNKLMVEIWLARYKNLGKNSKDFLGLTKLKEFMKEVGSGGAFGGGLSSFSLGFQKELEGVPVKMVNYQDNDKETYLLEKLKAINFPKNQFVVPPSFTQTNLPF